MTGGAGGSERAPEDRTVPGGEGPRRIRGVGVDDAGRCVHWRSPVDIVSFRFPCCDGWWACHDCHEAVADHPARPWPTGDLDEAAVLCGACRATLTIEAYLASPEACPRCAAPFNPRCRAHHPRYFQVEETSGDPGPP